MPIRHSIIHQIDKKPDGSPSILHTSAFEMLDSQARDNLLTDLNESYNAKPGKAWGLFHEESGAYPLSGWLRDYLDGKQDFIAFSHEAVEHLQKLMEESNLTVGGYVFLAHYQQGMTDYLTIALLHHSEGVVITDRQEVAPTKHLDLTQLHLAARINLSEWRNNPKSRQYISFLKGKGGRRVYDYFRDFIGCQEGIDAPGETRTLLKAFSDFVESEDLAEDAAREKTNTLVGYATSQAKLGEPISLEELAALVDEDRPQAFYDFIRNKDYGMSPEFPADKRTLIQFKRFTGRADGLSISFDSSLLGNKVEFDHARNQLVIRQVPQQLADQLKRAEHGRLAGEAAPEGEDPLYQKAVNHVRMSGRASISNVQRHFKIGYNHAARLIEAMEMAGIVTAMNSNGQREVVRHG